MTGDFVGGWECCENWLSWVIVPVCGVAHWDELNSLQNPKWRVSGTQSYVFPSRFSIILRQILEKIAFCIGPDILTLGLSVCP